MPARQPDVRLSISWKVKPIQAQAAEDVVRRGKHDMDQATHDNTSQVLASARHGIYISSHRRAYNMNGKVRR